MEHQKNIQIQQRKGREIILFPVPLQGHINPMLQLADILYAKGFSIIIIHTEFNSPKPSDNPHFTFYSIPDGLLESEASTSDVFALLFRLNVSCVKPFQDLLAKLLSKDLQESIACLITDVVWHFTQAVANNLKLPRIVLQTSSVSSFFVYVDMLLLQERGYLPFQDSQLEASVPELQQLKVKDLPVIEASNPEVIYQLTRIIMKETKASSGLIWNSYEDLEHDALIRCRKDFPVPVFAIGPFHKYFPAASSSFISHDQSCISWLDKQAPNSVLYVSFGSVAAINKTEFLEIAWGLANSKQPFLWVVRRGLVRSSEWLEPLPEGYLQMLGGRGHIVEWAPQHQVLVHPAIGGFWTHCGWNSTLESVCEGKPMICQPSFGDQRVNARYVSHIWRVGIHMEYRLERDEIERTIRRLMVDDEGQEMRDRIEHMKEKMNLCLRQEGSSYQSLESLVTYILSLL